jgi:hypothetical protein
MDLEKIVERQEEINRNKGKPKKDITKKINLESLAVKKNKGIIKFSDDITFSSSSLINNFSDLYNQQQKSFFDNVKVWCTEHKLSVAVVFAGRATCYQDSYQWFKELAERYDVDF